MALISSASQIIDRMVGTDILLHEGIEAHRINIRIAQMIYDARNAAGLTHAALAKKIGTKAQVVQDLEDADYDGDALAMLHKVARVLGKEINLQWAHAKSR